VFSKWKNFQYIVCISNEAGLGEPNPGLRPKIFMIKYKKSRDKTDEMQRLLGHKYLQHRLDRCPEENCSFSTLQQDAEIWEYGLHNAYGSQD
jgi:hypothetical protein